MPQRATPPNPAAQAAICRHPSTLFAPRQRATSRPAASTTTAGGNRRLNAILYRVALTQIRASPLAQAYLDRRISEGKTRREAIRALKRHLVRVIWRAWQECQQPADGVPIGVAA
jgi:hypothetical protein